MPASNGASVYLNRVSESGVLSPQVWHDAAQPQQQAVRSRGCRNAGRAGRLAFTKRAAPLRPLRCVDRCCRKGPRLQQTTIANAIEAQSACYVACVAKA